MELNENDLFDENLSGTIFEDIGDLPIMSFINKKIRGKSDMFYVSYDSLTSYASSSKTQETIVNAVKSAEKNISDKEYYKFMTKRLGDLIAIRPGADTNLLFRIAVMEWNHICSLNARVKK